MVNSQAEEESGNNTKKELRLMELTDFTKIVDFIVDPATRSSICVGFFWGGIGGYFAGAFFSRHFWKKLPKCIEAVAQERQRQRDRKFIKGLKYYKNGFR